MHSNHKGLKGREWPFKDGWCPAKNYEQFCGAGHRLSFPHLMHRVEQQQEVQFVVPASPTVHRFGNLPMVQSTTYCTKKYTTIGELAPTMEGKEVLVRGRVHTVRAKGKLGFCTLRGTPFSVQCVISESEAMPKEAVKWVGSLSCESLVDCRGKIVLPEKPITSVTQSEVHLLLPKLGVSSASSPQQSTSPTRPATRHQQDALICMTRFFSM